MTVNRMFCSQPSLGPSWISQTLAGVKTSEGQDVIVEYSQTGGQSCCWSQGREWKAGHYAELEQGFQKTQGDTDGGVRKTGKSRFGRCQACSEGMGRYNGRPLSRKRGTLKTFPKSRDLSQYRAVKVE